MYRIMIICAILENERTKMQINAAPAGDTSCDLYHYR